jgi:hypothetical protein
VVRAGETRCCVFVAQYAPPHATAVSDECTTNDVFGGNAVCGLQGEGEKTAQFVVWMPSTIQRRKGTKFLGNPRSAFPVAEADWHEFRWAIHHDMKGHVKIHSMEKDFAVEKRLEVELRALKLPMWTESEIGCGTHDCAHCFEYLESSLASLQSRGLVSARCSARCGGLDAVVWTTRSCQLRHSAGGIVSP